MPKLEFYGNYHDTVVCDMCNEDYTGNKDAIGGAVMGSTAYCPKCSHNLIEDAKKYGEEKYLTLPKEGEAFSDFILRYRKEMYGSSDLIVSVTSFNQNEDMGGE